MKNTKKLKITFTPNLLTIALNAKDYYENCTLEGRATKHERMANEVVTNRHLYIKKEKL